jgi:predicted aminopeptidase
VTLAEVIFHELLHNTLFVKDAVDFNESLANFVGSRAAILFFHEQNGVNSSEYLQAVQAWDEELEFAKFLAELAQTLNDLYAKDISLEDKLRLREEVFFRSQKEWAARVANRPKHRYGRFAQQTLNNAAIAHHLLYLSQLDLFESLFVIAGRDLRAFVELVGKHVKGAQDPFAVVRGLLNESRLGAAIPQS